MTAVSEIIDTVLTTLNNDEKWEVVESLLSVLRAKGLKTSKKIKDLDAPKRPMNNYMHLLHKVVSPALGLLYEESADETEMKILKQLATRQQVTLILYNKIKESESEQHATLIANITHAMIIDAYKGWWKTKQHEISYVSSPEPKLEEPKAKAKLEEPKAKAKLEEPKAKLEEPKAKEPKAKEPKAKAKLEEPKAKVKEDELTVEYEPYMWTHSSGKVYERIDDSGKNYLFDITTKDYIGVWLEKNKTIHMDKKKYPDPRV
jgi:hypothetical protein